MKPYEKWEILHIQLVVWDFFHQQYFCFSLGFVWPAFLFHQIDWSSVLYFMIATLVNLDHSTCCLGSKGCIVTLWNIWLTHIDTCIETRSEWICFSTCQVHSFVFSQSHLQIASPSSNHLPDLPIQNFHPVPPTKRIVVWNGPWPSVRKAPSWTKPRVTSPWPFTLSLLEIQIFRKHWWIGFNCICWPRINKPHGCLIGGVPF